MRYPECVCYGPTLVTHPASFFTGDTPFSNIAGKPQANATTPPTTTNFSRTSPPLLLYSPFPSSILFFRRCSCCSCVRKCPSRSKCGTSLLHPIGFCPGLNPPPSPAVLAEDCADDAAAEAAASACACLLAPWFPHPPLL